MDKTKALSLIPSLSRPREPEKVTTPAVLKRETKELIPHAIVPGITSTRSSRMTIRPELPIPEPNKAKKEYVPASEITRDWRYDLFPSRVYDEEDKEHVVRRPPTIRTTDKRALDTYVIREREISRVFFAVQFFIKKYDLSAALSECCDKIEDICLEFFSGNYSPHEALARVASQILEDVDRRRLWEPIHTIRQGLVDIVNSENRRALAEVIEENPEVLLLYGNNLFLAILVVMEKVHAGYSLSNGIYLWETVAEWELYQLGFKAQQGSVKTKYDFQAIFSNLMFRARNLPQLRLPKHELVKHRAGQIVWIEYENEYAAWVVFQKKNKMVAGFITDLPGVFDLRPKWHRCINDPKILVNAAKLSLESIEKQAITITTVDSYEVLWMVVRYESGKELTPYVLEYKTPRKGQLTVPWIDLKPPWKKEGFDQSLLMPPVQDDDDDVEDLVDDHLRKITSKQKSVIQVTCEIDVDASKKLYVLDFKDKSDESIVDTMTFKETDKIVRVIRHVLRTGEPLKTPNGTQVVWDNTTDVVYYLSDDTTKKTPEYFSVSFLKPLVHRRSFLPGYFTYPRTCEELVDAKNDSEVKLIASKSRNRFKVELEGLSSTSRLKKIERLELGIYDIGLLAECEQLIDLENQTRHQMSISIEDSLAESSTPDMSDFPRFQKVKDALIESKTKAREYGPGFGELTEEMFIELSEIEVFADEEIQEDESIVKRDHEKIDDGQITEEEFIELSGIEVFVDEEIQDDESIAKLDHVTTGEDSVGGEVIFVILKIGNKTPKIPVTSHFHNIREIGRMSKDKFVSSVKSKLDEYNLTEDDLNQAVSALP